MRAQIFSRKWVRVTAWVITVYIVLWFVTHFFGVPEVSHVVKRRMPIDKTYDYTDVKKNVKGSKGQPTYFCRATAYAPFLVRGDYAWQAAPLIGEGGSNLYLWFFGWTVRIYELEHWLS
jgi:hypothetical protein